VGFSYGLGMAASSISIEHIKRADPDRFFCSLFAPADQRASLWLLYAFNHELARAREVGREPMLALIRLQWWREVVEGSPKHHEIATPLRAALAAGVFAPADLLALIAAREVEAEPEIPDFAAFMDYARGTAGRLARIAGRVLGEDSAAAEDFGTAYGISGILRAAPFLARQGRSLLPADGTAPAVIIAAARGLLQARLPRIARAAALPAAFAQRDLGKPYAPRGLADRLAVVRAAFTGRI
jgi:phytoene synthase